MFSVKFKGVTLGVSFSFFAVIALLFVCTEALAENIFAALICCFFHELGHLTLMFLFSDKPESIILYGGGIRITPRTGRLLSKAKDIGILLAGCAVNFICAGIWFCLFGLDFYCEVNILLGVFNLLPFRYFDGGRTLEILLNGSSAYDIICALFIFMGAAAIILMYLNGAVNVSFILTFFFVVFSEILY